MINILLYSLYTIIASLIGIAVPYYLNVSKSVIRIFMALSAGILLGICGFHLIPESIEHVGNLSVIGILLGFFIPIFLERFSKKEDYKSNHHGDLPLFNMLTFIAFSMHSFVDGLLLNNEMVSHSAGMATIIGVITHKLPVAFSLMTILKTHLQEKRKLYIFLGCFVLMTPLGAILGYEVIANLPMSVVVQLSSITAGIFLYIALIHLYYDHKLYNDLKSNTVVILGIVCAGVFFELGSH